MKTKIALYWQICRIITIMENIKNKKLTAIDIAKRGLLMVGATAIITTASCGGGDGDSGGGGGGGVPTGPNCIDGKPIDPSKDCNGNPIGGGGDNEKTLDKYTSADVKGVNFMLGSQDDQTSVNTMISGNINTGLKNQLTELRKQNWVTVGVNNAIDNMRSPQDTISGKTWDMTRVLQNNESHVNTVVGAVDAYVPKINGTSLTDAFRKGTYLEQRKFWKNDATGTAAKLEAETDMNVIYNKLGITPGPNAMKELTQWLIEEVAGQQTAGGQVIKGGLFDLLQLVETSAKARGWTKDVMDLGLQATGDGRTHDLGVACMFDLYPLVGQKLNNGGVQVANRKLRDAIVNGITRRPDDNEIVS